VLQTLVPAASAQTAVMGEMQVYAGTDIAAFQNRDVFFLPKYHRWGMDLPPISELNQLS
jgi:hypothetical protein